MIRFLVAIPLALVTLAVGVWGYSAAILNAVTAAPASAEPNTFDGRALLTVSDADMVASAYTNGVLMQVPGQRDTLTVLPLPLDPAAPEMTEVFVSNSVTSWPQVLATSPDGERAYVVETAAEIADDVAELPEIRTNPPLGRSVTVVDLESGAATVHDVMDYPLHIAVHPDERFLALGSAAAGEPLGIIPVESLDDPSTHQFFAVERADGTPTSEVTSVSWHPTGDFLAVGLDSEELAFFAVDAAADGTLSLTPHGDTLILGNTITYGQFTANGSYYLTAEINWAAVPGSLGYVLNPPGDMISVRFDEDGAHTVASRVAVGQSPEGFAVHPEESLIVAVDMRRTYLPDALTFVPGTHLNSLSLLTFDNETGALALVDQYGFEGVLPEHAAFDADGDALGVVVYNTREAPMEPGYIEFWNVEQDPPALLRTPVQIEVVRGPHTMALVP